MNKFLKIMDNLVDQHTVNGATMFGVALAILAISDLIKANAPNIAWIFSIGYYFYLLMAIYEFFWKGIIRKKMTYSQNKSS